VISKINKLSFNTKSTGNIFNYTNFISNVDSTFNNIAINYIKNYITMIDNNYKNSLDRKRKYHISVTHKRTILTVFAEITYKELFINLSLIILLFVL